MMTYTNIISLVAEFVQSIYYAPAVVDGSVIGTAVLAKIDDGTLNSVHDVFDYIKEHYSVASVIDNVLGLTEYVVDGNCKVLVLVNSATPGHELRAKVEIWLNV